MPSTTKPAPGQHKPRARCAYPGCGHAEHPGQCRAKGRHKCEYLIDYQTGEPINSIVCSRVRPQCPCPFETCKCGEPVAVAQLIPGGGYFPVVRGSAGTGTLEVWLWQDAMYVRELPPGTEPGEGRWRGRSHEPDCPKAAEWQAERAQAEAEARLLKADPAGWLHDQETQAAAF